MSADNQSRFSWRAFAVVVLGMATLSYRWHLQRHYSEHGWDINWYRSMVTPVFYALSVGLPLLTAIAVGRLMALRRRGATIAAAAVVTAAALAFLLAVPVFTAWDAEHGAMAKKTCLRHLQWLVVAMQSYTEDNDGCLPPDQAWVQSVRDAGNLEHLLHCPADQSENGVGYALNAEATGKRLEGLPESLPLFFDAAQPVAHPGEAEFRHPRRWGQVLPREPGVMVVYRDGHPDWVSQSEWQHRFGEP